MVMKVIVISKRSNGTETKNNSSDGNISLKNLVLFLEIVIPIPENSEEL